MSEPAQGTMRPGLMGGIRAGAIALVLAAALTLPGGALAWDRGFGRDGVGAGGFGRAGVGAGGVGRPGVGAGGIGRPGGGFGGVGGPGLPGVGVGLPGAPAARPAYDPYRLPYVPAAPVPVYPGLGFAAGYAAGAAQ
jgi:hypothetical protein